MFKTILILIFTLSVNLLNAQKTIRYDLYVTDTLVNFTGEEKAGIAINGKIPAPTLEFTEGDSVVIVVHNQMETETSIHWHGLLLANEQDGVPYLTTSPIKANSNFMYNFRLRQSGTYWYHSHTMLQEQIGMYGAFIVHKQNENTSNQEVLLLSDWSDENPNEIERSLHYATDWYSIKKGATQNYWEAIKAGHFDTKVENEFKRMHAMDVSDVYYDKFLINGKEKNLISKYQSGDIVRLRVINGSASTYFWLNYQGSKIKVIASDGIEVEAVEVDRLMIAVSETYDIEIRISDSLHLNHFLATAEDRSSFASLTFGTDFTQIQTPLERLKYFEGMKMMNEMTTLGGNMTDMGMEMSLQKMDMNTVMYPENTDTLITLNYAMLKSKTPTNFNDTNFRTLNFELTGNMNRYVWTLDNQTISEADKIFIKKGENIRIVLKNNSMMRHPMHLHGHFFRVVNGQGDYAPLKNVLDIMPMETDTIEFNASEEYGDWYFHCHILYHMMSGMGRIFTYENTPYNPNTNMSMVYMDDERMFLSALINLESNKSSGNITYSNTRWEFKADWEMAYNVEKSYEAEGHFGRYVDQNQFLFAYLGWDFRYSKEIEQEKNIFGQFNSKNKRGILCLGFEYTLPLLIKLNFRLDHLANIRLQIERDDIAITERLRIGTMWNSDKEFEISSYYILSKYLALSASYDNKLGIGAGIRFQY